MVPSKSMTISAFFAAMLAGSCAAMEDRGCQSSACMEDARIRDQVKAQLDQNLRARSFNIQVQTSNHVVYLSGLVGATD